ncbi:class I SAM-dependent methyltransferase [Paenibacillus thalictri]|uniref:Class I SAM-dependent methyltransferase n=1 Tax=Paenibacillus thalictri TaxID=2527873 RepID=A0A4Q9DSI1_9BACL|nr:class I SAM-dependent methyltransferase [Paenibacillus thalictri]TBL78915.1 class I SAM-dependent methyltransferase [Paenibacillus thalictri]
MGVDWYNMIARRNGGYKSNATFTVEGISSEDIFEEELIKLLAENRFVLDAGCGHGDFTLKMARFAESIIGFDNSIEMINIAESLLQESKINNVMFKYATTKEQLPFSDEQFDLIYDRRGPTSILNHSRILRSGGIVFGIHSGALDKVKERLHNNGFINIEISEYNEATVYFPNENEFAKFISGTPGNPDYTLAEYEEELKLKIEENLINGRLGMKEYRYIWKAIKP